MNHMPHLKYVFRRILPCAAGRQYTRPPHSSFWDELGRRADRHLSPCTPENERIRGGGVTGALRTKAAETGPLDLSKFSCTPLGGLDLVSNTFRHRTKTCIAFPGSLRQANFEQASHKLIVYLRSPSRSLSKHMMPGSATLKAAEPSDNI